MRPRPGRIARRLGEARPLQATRLRRRTQPPRCPRANATSDRGPSLRAFPRVTGSLQVELHDDRVLAPLRRGVIAATHADLGETRTRIKRASRLVRRAYFEKYLVGA